MNRFKANPNDVVIVVMGPTGSGKTNFINALTGNAAKAKAGRLESVTQSITPYTMLHRGLRLVLVDTPGFDDTYRSDMEILRLIADWLTKKYPDGETLKLTGVVYLHRITDNRMSGSAYKNLQMFGRLCGNIPLRRARLVTTMWDMARQRSRVTSELEPEPEPEPETRKKIGNEIRKKMRVKMQMELKMEYGKKPRVEISQESEDDIEMVTPKEDRKENKKETRKETRRTTRETTVAETTVAKSREQELIKEYWGPLIAAGAIAERFDNTARSALRIIDDLIGLEIAKDELLIQEELVEQHKRLNETEAGKVLYSRFQQLLSEQRRTLKELANEARLGNNPTLARSLQEEYDQINARLQMTFDKMKAMKIPLNRRILLLFGGRSRGKAVKLDLFS